MNKNDLIAAVADWFRNGRLPGRGRAHDDDKGEPPSQSLSRNEYMEDDWMKRSLRAMDEVPDDNVDQGNCDKSRHSCR